MTTNSVASALSPHSNVPFAPSNGSCSFSGDFMKSSRDMLCFDRLG